MEKVLLILTQTPFVVWAGPAQGERALLGDWALWRGMWVLAAPETWGYTTPISTLPSWAVWIHLTMWDWSSRQLKQKLGGIENLLFTYWPLEQVDDIYLSRNYICFCFCILCGGETDLQKFILQKEVVKSWGTALQLGSCRDHSCWDAGRWLCR